MPPPTASDAWLKSRRFGIVIDAGSSGSRLQIYSWKNTHSAISEGGDNARYSLPKVEKGSMVGEDWVSKVEPGMLNLPVFLLQISLRENTRFIVVRRQF